MCKLIALAQRWSSLMFKFLQRVTQIHKNHDNQYQWMFQFFFLS